MSGLDYLAHEKNLTSYTYCTAYPCVGRLAEPTTMITDYILFVELVALAALLLRFSWTATPLFARYWAVGLCFLGASFFFGGSEHGFALRLKCDGRDVCIASSWVWIVTLLLQTPGLALPVVGTSHLVLSADSVYTTAAFYYAVAMVLIFSTIAIIGAVATPLDGFLVSFGVVILFSMPSVLWVLTLLSLPVCCGHGAHGLPGQRTALAGWIVCIVSLAWQASGIGVHEHFNHNDIFHAIFIVGIAMVYLGLAPQLTAEVGSEGEPLSPPHVDVMR